MFILPFGSTLLCQVSFVDTTFQVYNMQSHGSVYHLYELPDKRLLIGGGFSDSVANISAIGMLHTDGSIDTTFQSEVDAAVNLMDVKDDTIFVQYYNRFEKLDFFGNRIDTGWSNNFNEILQPTTFFISGIVHLNDGSCIISTHGVFIYKNNQKSVKKLLWIKSNGKIDTTMLFDTDFSMNNIVKYDENRFMMSGGFFNYNGIPVKGICRIYNNGIMDTTFNSCILDGGTKVLHIQPDGKVIGAGMITVDNLTDTLWLHRFNADGSLDMTFNNQNSLTFHTVYFGSWARIETVCPTADGGYLIGGMFDYYQGYNRKNIVKTDYNGFIEPWALPNTYLDENMYQIMARVRTIIQGQDDYYVGGEISMLNGVNVSKVCRLNGQLIEVEEINMDEEISIYPNPAKDNVIVKSLKYIEQLEIYNLEGQLLQITKPGKKEVSIDVSALPPGYYLIRVSGWDEVFVRKFVVVR